MMYTPEKATALINNSLWDTVTDISNWDSEELLELLAEDTESDKWVYVSPHRMEVPPPIPESIAEAPPLRPELTSCVPATDGLGNLGRLPLEVVWRIVDNMDIEVFLRFAQTSRLARSLCKRHPAFRNIGSYLPSMLIALKSLELHQWVPVGAIWGEIQQPKCRSCGENGQLLFLPTCDRICVNCLTYNPAYWSVPFFDAKLAFALEHRHLERVPAFRDIVVTVRGNRLLRNPDNPAYLFPIKPTLKLAIQVHGSREAMKTIAERHAVDRFLDSSGNEQIMGFLHRFWRDAPLEKLSCDPTLFSKPDLDLLNARTYSDIDIRRASAWIPFLPPRSKSPVKLYRCKGCDFIDHHRFKITSEHRRYMGDADLDVTPGGYELILANRRRIVRTWKDMQDHIPKCLGSGLRMWCRHVLTQHHDDLSSDF